MLQIGSVDAIWLFPTKSLRGETLEEALVDVDGLRGDRTRAMVVDSGHARVGKPYRGKEHERYHLVDDAERARAMAAERGVQVTERGGERFFDDAPVSLIVDRWLDGLNAHAGYRVEPLRFRPNFFVCAAPGFVLDEGALTGWELQTGEVRLLVRNPIGRCVTTTYDPAGGASDPRVLQFVAQSRNNWMGIYCDVIEPGIVRRGDEVRGVLPGG